MIGFLNCTMFRMVLLVPLFQLNGGRTISSRDNLALQGQLEIRTPLASKRNVLLGWVILATSSWVAPLSRA